MQPSAPAQATIERDPSGAYYRPRLKVSDAAAKLLEANGVSFQFVGGD